MPQLFLASLVWAFSFGLVGKFLPPSQVPPAFVAAARLALALLVFLPLLRRDRSGWPTRARYAAVGAVQFGLVYVTYLAAFGTLKSHEVALLTVFTPLFVWIGGDLLDRRLAWRHLGAALLACVGAGVVLGGRAWESSAWTGLVLMQISNLAFASGQLAYRSLKRSGKLQDEPSGYAWMLVGAFLTTLPWGLWQTHGTLPSLAPIQWLTLVYLGVVATGLGFFWWNRGAARVDVGVLAAANNLKIPLGVAVSLLFFGSSADWVRTLAGMVIVVAAMAWSARETEERGVGVRG